MEDRNGLSKDMNSPEQILENARVAEHVRKMRAAGLSMDDCCEILGIERPELAPKARNYRKDLEELKEKKAKEDKAAMALKLFIGGVLVGAADLLATMYAWNVTMPRLFDLPTLTAWDTMGLGAVMLGIMPMLKPISEPTDAEIKAKTKAGFYIAVIVFAFAWLAQYMAS